MIGKKKANVYAIGPNKPNQSISQNRQSRKVYEGPLFKRGRFHQGWKNRWFVLYNNRTLSYYNDKKESLAFRALGDIDLSEVEYILNDRSKDAGNKYVFEIKTGNRTYSLSCLDIESLNLWDKYLNQSVFGNIIHVGWLIKKGDKIQSWRKRWFTLSNLQELRYFEDETLKKWKGTINLEKVSIIRHGDKEQYGYEYTIEIITPQRTWVLVTTYHELRELWMDKLSDAMDGGIKMNVLYEGYLWKFEDSSIGDKQSNASMADWSKKYYGIDHQTLKLYYVSSYNKFKQFASTLFFDKDYYEQAVDTQLQGCVSIQYSVVDQYGNDDMRFDNTSQKSNPNIFRIKNVLGEYYFAADNELGMNEWIHHLGVAINSGQFTVGRDNDSDSSSLSGGGNHVIGPLVPRGAFLPDPGDSSNSDDDIKSNNNNQIQQPKPKPIPKPKPKPKPRAKPKPIPNKIQPIIHSNNNVFNNGFNNGFNNKNKNKHNDNKGFGSGINGINNGFNSFNNKKKAKPKKSIAPQRVKNTEPIWAQLARDAAQKKLDQDKHKHKPQPKIVPPIGNVYDKNKSNIPAPPNPPNQNNYMHQQQQQQSMNQYNVPMNAYNNPYNNQQMHSSHSNNNNSMTVMGMPLMPNGMPMNMSNNSMNNNMNMNMLQMNQKQSNPLNIISSKYNNISFGTAELQLVSSWTEIIQPFIGRPQTLEANAAYPCDLDGVQVNNQLNNQVDDFGASSLLHDKCQCVQRVSLILNYYSSSWIKINSSNRIGMAYILSILQDYSMTELLNDFFHLKRFHSEGVCNNDKIDPLTQYFIFKYGTCDMNLCIHLGRNNRNKLKCFNENILRAFYFIDKLNDANNYNNNKKLIFEEICTQQILDMIHCYIYHGSYYSLYEYKISTNDIKQIRTNYANKKQNFQNNRYLTKIHKWHHIPYKPMNVATPKGPVNNNSNNNNPLLDNNFNEGTKNNNNNQWKTPNNNNDDGKYNDVNNMYEYTTNSFGIDMEHNIYSSSLQKYGPSKYASFRDEMVYRTSIDKKYALSDIQFNIISLRSNILLSTFEGKLLKARRIHESSTFILDKLIYNPNSNMTSSMCQALLIYCNYNQFRNSLTNSYFKIYNQHESLIDCRRRHYKSFYNWGKLLYTAIIAFGTDIYSKDNSCNDNYYYHNVTQPVLFNKFNCCFYGPTSCTTSKNIALIHMPVNYSDGIILELDTNNVGWTTPYNLNISIYSSNSAECEQLFIGGASLGIHNIISVFNHTSVSNLSNYTSAITLLRYIIGDTNTSAVAADMTHMNQQSGQAYSSSSSQDDDYDILITRILDLFDERIFRHLILLIDNQVNLYKNNKNINDYRNYSTRVPLYISLILNSWCLNKKGIIQLNQRLLRRLPKPLQHKFVYESPDILNDFSLNWSSIFNLFPNCNKIWKRGLYFNNYLCEQYIYFLCNENISAASDKYKMDGIVFSCTQESDWKKWVQTAKKHSSIIKSMGWLITASPPKRTVFGAIETGRVSFIKRVNQN